MAALNRAWSLRCQVRSAGAGPVVEGLALAVIVRGGVSFPGGRYVAPIASATRRASPEFSEPGARRTGRNDYPSVAWRRSYARRTGAERGFATAKDPATNDINRGWCRLTGPAPLMLFTTTLLIVRNQRILSTWDARQAENARRAAAGLPPKTRKRRRKTLTVLTTATRPP